jgi:DNA-binding XRE family transcriptional regulator
VDLADTEAPATAALHEIAAVELSEDILALRDVERRHNDLKEANSAFAPKMVPRIRDASVQAMISLKAYRFAREAPLGILATHKLSLPNFRAMKLRYGATLESLGKRLGLPEATMLLIEDGQEVSLRLAARIAHAISAEYCEVGDLALEPGQTIADYWKEL